MYIVVFIRRQMTLLHWLTFYFRSAGLLHPFHSKEADNNKILWKKIQHKKRNGYVSCSMFLSTCRAKEKKSVQAKALWESIEMVEVSGNAVKRKELPSCRVDRIIIVFLWGCIRVLMYLWNENSTRVILAIAKKCKALHYSFGGRQKQS